MPQMAPMSWLLLFFFFSFMLIMINILNYYSFQSKIKILKFNNSVLIKPKTWKW